MTPELARLKLGAYLHNPPLTPFVLGRGHEGSPLALLEALIGDAAIPEAARRADQLASAADRPNFPLDSPAIDFARRPALTHPLSAARALELDPLPIAVDPAVVGGHVLEAARRLAEACGGDFEKRYLATWRWLGEYIRAAEPRERRLGALWEWLPADTRVPDHCIWDQMSMTAAIAGGGERPAFLLFALGPVQGFIAQARTTRDLWAGSYLLSWLSWQAIRVVAEELGPDAVLYPALRGQPLVDAWLAERGVPAPEGARGAPAVTRRIAGFPNKFLALVPERDAQPLARRVEERLRRAWDGLSTEVQAWLSGRARDRWQPERWAEQGAQQLETSWVALPWPQTGAEDEWLARVRQLVGSDGLSGFVRTLQTYSADGRFGHNPGSYYGPVHGLVQRAFEARKLARAFEPSAEPGFKCSLCGARAPALSPRAGYREQVAAWQALAVALGRPGLVPLDGDERLCAVCLTKRLAPETQAIERALGGPAPDFPSTSSLATLAFRKGLIEKVGLNESLADAARRFLEALDGWERYARALGGTVRIPAHVFPSLLLRAQQAPPDIRPLVERLLGFDGEWLLAETYGRWRSTLRRLGSIKE